ncbi:hypothetical protein BCR42DRAFT_456011 [Absidia repens]|uniref:Heterokaryon incompatibility domain-containing protein n=1 Tax=Absidia repens TaxID=90262 RepID=A0A1X2I1Q5_9FUNG|nr:hypothetical protein BCR42DRAFT_456011 [Absidia repens]
MTKDDPVIHHFQELAIEDVQQQQQKQQQKAFHVVLVDIGIAAQGERIHCIETPLEECAEESRFVALSYRWGEIQEQVLDTGLGYLASITSFALEDFCMLCKMMMREPDFRFIKYVWVDAICVDQINYERRKATIHQMSNIYEKAAYILAVPDLHKKHLLNVSTENEKLAQLFGVSQFRKYIYYLIQGNTEQLAHLDDKFLDEFNVPKHRTLRQLLAKHTAYLSHGLTTDQGTAFFLNDPEDTLEFICQTYEASLPNRHKDLDLVKGQTQKDACGKNDPLDDVLDQGKVTRILKSGYYRSNKVWTHELIRRGNTIRQAMKFLEDLIRDWSTRVWVISEYNIAKKKNNLKYWFIQLSNPHITKLSFFKFDFTDPAFSSDVKNGSFDDPISLHHNPNPVDLSFHSMIIKQLSTQTFLEMMLKSKASRNQDRFYAVLPQSKYKDKVSQVGHWEINTLLSVKLKLFEIMDTKDKWNLFFLSGYSLNTVKVLPTFVTPGIYWPRLDRFVEDQPCNFDTNRSNGSSPITLHHNDNLRLYYLQLAPMEYYVLPKDHIVDLEYSYIYDEHQKVLFNHLKLDKHCVIDFVFLHQYNVKGVQKGINNRYDDINNVTLIGSFKENKWILYPQLWSADCSGSRNNRKDGTVFNIY